MKTEDLEICTMIDDMVRQQQSCDHATKMAVWPRKGPPTEMCTKCMAVWPLDRRHNDIAEKDKKPQKEKS